MQLWLNYADRETRSTGRKNCIVATLSIRNLTWIDLGSNPSLCNVKQRLTAYRNEVHVNYL